MNSLGERGMNMYSVTNDRVRRVGVHHVGVDMYEFRAFRREDCRNENAVGIRVDDDLYESYDVARHTYFVRTFGK